ncbi:hypothetical protein HPP92_026680 [Vanilla planifolia]|uniref:Uncharacterized protein n=1 Tax=Vanilla planifolia TaxID=51239 RepID=A0A835PFK4_VANPL|nr:hypothetical protein HPP92_026680 [Vanilla planifolia]
MQNKIELQETRKNRSERTMLKPSRNGSYPVKIFRQTLLLKMFSLMVENAVDVIRGAEDKAIRVNDHFYRCKGSGKEGANPILELSPDQRKKTALKNQFLEEE